ncbi:MAG: methylenetetrahydrofolate--tRNA-(uracil(54)-C(5))-methyltransferase (FADH(2)-oxidizing) TrmFO [Clostridiales bacterium]|nr:methylenetetrahydrofolate--tRNA-(uracil(54)-C(5))-methyltransferase (FADH(2)-oxidizing) TrmFO [Clostridiales bacterium]
MRLTVIGAGLCGCEAAWAAANRGARVDLYEMKPACMSPAHHSPLLAELVCSNSLKAARLESAAGLLKEEMRRLGSICMEAAAVSGVAAGGALAVDREVFSGYVTEKIRNHPRIRLIEERVDQVPREGVTILATGPLTDGALAEDIKALCGRDTLSFFDAAAPIVTADSVDMSVAFRASRYGRGEEGEGDYINCPMNREEYEAFCAALTGAEAAPLKNFDKPLTVYEGCMPIEIMAKRGADTIRFGPLKPVGLKDPRTGHRPWAVVQLRRENAAGSMYNLVGFQTNLKFPEQKRVFSMIPGLREAEFVRYGVMHRNSFIDSPRLLSADFSLRARPQVFIAGQLSGVEGYMESAAAGILAGINAVGRLKGEAPFVPPDTAMTGALARYISDETVKHFQPMGANFGVLPPLPERIRDKQARYAALSARSLAWFDAQGLTGSQGEEKGMTKP